MKTVRAVAEIIEDGINGYVCRADAPEEMASRAIDLIRDTPRRVAMGRAAAAMVRERYCTARIVPLYEEAYARCARLT